MAQSSAAIGFGILLAQLAAAALRTIVLAGGVGLLSSLLKAPSARLFAWTAVLYAGLSMPLLAGMLHPLSIAVPFLTPHATTGLVFTSRGSLVSVELPSSEQLVHTKAATRNVAIAPGTRMPKSHNLPSQGSRASSWISSLPWIQWTVLAGAAYLVITVFLLFRLIAGVRFARRLVLSSRPIHEARIFVRLRSRAHGREPRFVPCVQESPLVSVPVTVGVIAPTVVLPINWHEWDHAKLGAVISHEMAHVIRRDALTRYISLLYRAIFWFSPLAWWLNRHLAELAEEASDEAALAAGAERTCYASTVLGFFQALKDSPGRVRWQGISIASPGQPEKRIEKILTWREEYPMRLKRSVIALVIGLAIPAIYLTAAARPVAHSQSSQNTTGAQGQVSPPPIQTPTEPQPPVSAPAAPSAPPAQADGGVSNSGPPPAQPIAPAAPSPPVPPAASQEEKSAENAFSKDYGFDDEQRFVIVSGQSHTFTTSGTSEDVHHAEKLRKRIPGDFIWFQRDEKSYIIRDQTTIDRARQLWLPQEALGRKQAELGKEQEALGKQQQELGLRMQRVRVKVPDMTAELDRLKAELQRTGPDASMEQIGKIQAQVGELQAKIGQLQAKAGDEQGEFGAKMGALGERQGKLGEQQGELGRQQAELAAKARRAMKELLDEAIKKGLAQPEPLEPGTASL